MGISSFSKQSQLLFFRLYAGWDDKLIFFHFQCVSFFISAFLVIYYNIFSELFPYCPLSKFIVFSFFRLKAALNFSSVNGRVRSMTVHFPEISRLSAMGIYGIDIAVEKCRASLKLVQWILDLRSQYQDSWLIFDTKSWICLCSSMIVSFSYSGISSVVLINVTISWRCVSINQGIPFVPKCTHLHIVKALAAKFGPPLVPTSMSSSKPFESSFM